MDMSKLAELIGAEAATEDQDQIAAMGDEEVQEILRTIYGGDSMDFWVGTSDKYLVYTAGGNENVRAQAVNGVKAASSTHNAALNWAIDTVAHRSPSMVYQLDFGAIVHQSEALFQAMDEDWDEVPAGVPQSALTTAYYVVEDLNWHSGVRLDWKALAQMIRTTD